MLLITLFQKYANVKLKIPKKKQKKKSKKITILISDKNLVSRFVTKTMKVNTP